MNIRLHVSIAVLAAALAVHSAAGQPEAAEGESTGSTAATISGATAIRDRVNLYLEDAVAGACRAVVPLAERVDGTASILAALRKFIRASRATNPHPGEKDMIFLAYVEDNIDPREWIPGGRLTGKAVLQFEVDLAGQFAAHYALYFAVGDDRKPASGDFRHDWAEKIYAALSCLRLPGAAGRQDR